MYSCSLFFFFPLSSRGQEDGVGFQDQLLAAFLPLLSCISQAHAWLFLGSAGISVTDPEAPGCTA